MQHPLSFFDNTASEVPLWWPTTMQQSRAAVDAGRDCEDQELHKLVLGTAKLRRFGILKFGLAKPCHRQSAVNILTGSSHQPTLTGSTSAVEPQIDHDHTVIAYKMSSRFPSSSPVKINISSTPRSGRSVAGCCTDDDAVQKDVKHDPCRLYTFVNSSSDMKDSRSSSFTAAAPDIPQAHAAAGRPRNSWISSNRSDVATAADASHGQTEGTMHSKNIITDSGKNSSGSGCVASHPAAVHAVQLQHATVGEKKTKTYTAALLRRQEAQLHEKGREQRHQRQTRRRANVECVQQRQDSHSSNCGTRHNSSTASLPCCLSLGTPAQVSKALEPAILSAFSNSSSIGSSSIPGLHLSSLRRVSLAPCSSEGDAPQPCTPPLAAVDTHHARSFFSSSSSPQRTCSNGSHSTCSTAGSMGSVISKYDVPPVVAAGRSIPLSTLDAATAANSRAAAALRLAARRALHSGTAAPRPACRNPATAMQPSWSDAAASAHLSQGDQAAPIAVLGWYNEADGFGVHCTTERVKQQQQPCTCLRGSFVAAAICPKPGPRCVCGLKYSRLQRSSSNRSAQHEQQRLVQEQLAQPHDNQGCSCSSSSGSSTQSSHRERQAAVPAGDAAAASPDGVSGSTASSRMVAAAVPAISAECIAGASVEALLAASAWCITELEFGFEHMKRTSKELTETDGVPLREQYLQQVVA